MNEKCKVQRNDNIVESLKKCHAQRKEVQKCVLLVNVTIIINKHNIAPKNPTLPDKYKIKGILHLLCGNRQRLLTTIFIVIDTLYIT